MLMGAYPKLSRMMLEVSQVSVDDGENGAEQFPEQKSGGWNRSKRVNAIAIIIPLFRSFYPPSCDTVTPYRNICIKEEISLTFLSLEPSTITFTTFLRSGAG